LWAFNHDESTRSFARATQLDPDCAACYWGVALTVGPNYNLPVMALPRAQVAFDALTKAQKAAAHASPVDRALIDALAKRYPNAQPLDASNSAPILTAYAQAMKTVATQFPSDLDVQTLYAESMMNLNAWRLWTPEGKAAPGTEEIVATLESVLKRDPRHPGANHYYVHTLEASLHPDKAVAAAERLGGMMPAAGHLEHMPAHIMQRVGRYEEAAQANRKGAAADKSYFAKTQPPDYYAMYTGHNYQFLAYSAAMEGR
jgi:tetratricopeptide (TPR) repeat protein